MVMEYLTILHRKHDKTGPQKSLEKSEAIVVMIQLIVLVMVHLVVQFGTVVLMVEQKFGVKTEIVEVYFEMKQATGDEMFDVLVANESYQGGTFCGTVPSISAF